MTLLFIVDVHDKDFFKCDVRFVLYFWVITMYKQKYPTIIFIHNQDVHFFGLYTVTIFVDKISVGECCFVWIRCIDCFV